MIDKLSKKKFITLLICLCGLFIIAGIVQNQITESLKLYFRYIGVGLGIMIICAVEIWYVFRPRKWEPARNDIKSKFKRRGWSMHKYQKLMTFFFVFWAFVVFLAFILFLVKWIQMTF